MGNGKIQYYITSDAAPSLVIYGEGEIPSYIWENYPNDYCFYPAYSDSRFMYDVETVIIESGITALGTFTFLGRFSNDAFENIRRIVIRSANIRLTTDDPLLYGLSNKSTLRIIYDY